MVHESAVSIADSYFEGGSNDTGGAIKSLDSTVDITGCVFVGNDADWGGAVSMSGGSITDSIFYGNTAAPAAAALYAHTDAVAVSGCVFVNNWAEMDGGGIGGLVDVSDSVFSFNYPQGVMACRYSLFSGSYLVGNAQGVFSMGAVTLADAVIAGNGGTGYASGDLGGEIYSCGPFSAAASVLTNTTVAGNLGCGVWDGDLTWSQAHGSIIFDNGANVGGGTVEVLHSLVQGGYAGEGNLDADPLFAGYPAATGTWTDVYWDEGLFQTELTDDATSWAPGELTGLLVNLDVAALVTRWGVITGNSETAIWIWGNAVAYAETGDSYALFDLRLQPGSPAIDAGYGTGASALDLDGNPRFDDPITANTGEGDPAYVDMGAYEYQGPAPDAGADGGADGG